MAGNAPVMFRGKPVVADYDGAARTLHFGMRYAAGPSEVIVGSLR
jgi:hypothetical protein